MIGFQMKRGDGIKMANKQEKINRILEKMKEIKLLLELHRITPRSWETRDKTLRTRLLKETGVWN